MLASIALASLLHAVAPPPGFIQDTISSNWNELAGVAVLDDGRKIAWERGGRIWMLEPSGARIEPALLDLSDEVGGWRDHGLLSVAPHPNFLQNGQLFLLYVVDRHHLFNFGTPFYDPNLNAYFAASIGRITRYTAQSATNFTTIDPASRVVLLGESHTTGIPVVHQSHGVGTLLFGTDGTLLVSVGDNASYESVDLGGQVSGGYVSQALADGILTPKENVGAFRAQLVDCLCGKILRIDPSTGDGLPSNPFFDPAAPRAPRSRVWCLGVRNPFRMTIEPGTGSHSPAAGDPGVLLIGDVGWNIWEEFHRAESGGLNLGWPIFEGHTHIAAYAKANVANADAPNPLAGPGCAEPFLRFRSLLIQDTLAAAPAFWNPCGMLQAESAERSGPTSSTSAAGYHGGGYVLFPNDVPDAWIRFTADVATSGSWILATRYSLPGSPRTLLLSVDGVPIGGVEFPATGANTEWRVLEMPLELTAGSRVIEWRSASGGGPNLDGIAVHTPGAAPLLPAEIPHFVHRRAIADWAHTSATARTPTFNAAGAATTATIGSAGSPVSGTSFGGVCAIGGPRIHFDSWPGEWHDVAFFADFGGNYLRAFSLNASGAATSVKVFDPSLSSVVAIVADHHEECLWIVRWPDQLLRVRYAPGGNQLPQIVATSSQPWGPGPLAVSFDASGSFDPEGGELTFAWDFGDGATAVGPIVEHVFQGSGKGPHSYEVHLVVTDSQGGDAMRHFLVSVDNSPPSVSITSIFDGQLYPMDAKSLFPLEASIADAEHAVEQLACAWQVILHHNTHSHPEPPDQQCSSVAVITPLGCGGETYWYEVRCTVTDPEGLATTAVASLSPDCNGVLACGADFDGDGAVGASDLAILLGAWGTSQPAFDLSGDGMIGPADLGVLLGAWGPC